MSAQAANGRRPRRRRPGLSAGWRHNWRPSAQQYSIARFSPLMKPASLRPWRNPRSRPACPSGDCGRRGRPRRRATEQRDELTRFPLMGMHLIPSRVRNASLGYRIGADQSGGRCTAKFQSSLCRLRVIHVVLRCPRYVRSSPNSGGKADVAALLIRAISGREQSQQRRLIQSPRRRAQAAKEVRPDRAFARSQR